MKAKGYAKLYDLAIMNGLSPSLKSPSFHDTQNAIKNCWLCWVRLELFIINANVKLAQSTKIRIDYVRGY